MTGFGKRVAGMGFFRDAVTASMARTSVSRMLISSGAVVGVVVFDCRRWVLRCS